MGCGIAPSGIAKDHFPIIGKFSNLIFPVGLVSSEFVVDFPFKFSYETSRPRHTETSRPRSSRTECAARDSRQGLSELSMPDYEGYRGLFFWFCPICSGDSVIGIPRDNKTNTGAGPCREDPGRMNCGGFYASLKLSDQASFTSMTMCLDHRVVVPRPSYDQATPPVQRGGKL